MGTRQTRKNQREGKDQPTSSGAALALAVYQKVFEATESFKEENVNADFAYLMGAILKSNCMVEFIADRTLITVLRKRFPKTHPVWKHINIVK
jgi:hypothetical protein